MDIRLYCACLFLIIFGASAVCPPSITTHPQGGLFRKGARVTLECGASGDPAVETVWTLNERILDEQQGERYEFHSNGSLTITELQTDEQGIYQCEALNEFGRAFSLKAEVTYAHLHAVQEADDDDVHKYIVEENHGLKIPCGSGWSSNPKPRFYWTRSSQCGGIRIEVEWSKRVQMDLDGNIVFTRVELEDSDEDTVYECMAHNAFLDVSIAVSRAHIAILKQFPENSTEPPYAFGSRTQTKEVVFLGENVTFMCMSLSDQKLSTRWGVYSSGHLRQILPPNRTEIGQFGSTLTIMDLVFKDSGQYLCHTVKGSTYRTYSFAILVQSKPTFIDDNGVASTEQYRDMSVTAKTGQDVSFLCKGNSRPLGRTRWRINGEPIPHEDYFSKLILSRDYTNLTILNVMQRYDDGRSGMMVVQCNYSNSHGYVFAQGYLNVLEPVQMVLQPGEVEQRVAIGGNFVITCTATREGKVVEDVNISWISPNGRVRNNDRVFVKDIEPGKSRLFISNIEIQDGGLYRCIGSEEHSLDATIELITQERTEFTPDIEPDVGNLETRLVKCTATGPDNLDITWWRNGEPLQEVSGKYVFTDEGLKIHNMSDADVGGYECRAVNYETGRFKTRKFSIDMTIPTPCELPDRPSVAEIRSVSTYRVSITVLPESGSNLPNVENFYIFSFRNLDTGVAHTLKRNPFPEETFINIDYSSIYPVGRFETRVEVIVRTATDCGISPNFWQLHFNVPPYQR